MEPFEYQVDQDDVQPRFVALRSLLVDFARTSAAVQLGQGTQRPPIVFNRDEATPPVDAVRVDSAPTAASGAGCAGGGASTRRQRGRRARLRLGSLAASGRLRQVCVEPFDEPLGDSPDVLQVFVRQLALVKVDVEPICSIVV